MLLYIFFFGIFRIAVQNEFIFMNRTDLCLCYLIYIQIMDTDLCLCYSIQIQIMDRTDFLLHYTTSWASFLLHNTISTELGSKNYHILTVKSGNRLLCNHILTVEYKSTVKNGNTLLFNCSLTVDSKNMLCCTWKGLKEKEVLKLLLAVNS